MLDVLRVGVDRPLALGVAVLILVGVVVLLLILSKTWRKKK